MNLQQIVDRIQRVLKDRTILYRTIVDEINLQQAEATAKICNPNLVSTGKVTIAANAIGAQLPLVLAFQHSLLSAYSERTNTWLTIRTGTKALYDGYTMGDIGPIGTPGTSSMIIEDTATTQLGPISECAIEGDSVLWVRPASSIEDVLSLRYYRRPVVMAHIADIPEGIPSEQQQSILVSGTIVALLPETDLPPDIVKALMSLHGSLKADGMASLIRRYPFASKAVAKPRRLVREF